MLRNKKGQFKKGHGWIGIGNTKSNSGSFVKGQPAWNKGIKRWWESPTEFKKGISVSPSTQFKKGEMSMKMIGNKNSATKEKHWNWKGGTTKLSVVIRTSFAYSLWRKTVMQRDYYTCQECRQKSGKLTADHIKPFISILVKFEIKNLKDALNCKELWDVSNGRTLCWECHKKTPTFGIKARNYV